MRILQGIALAGLVLFLGICCLVAWDAHRAARELPALATDTRRSVLILGGAATDLEKTLRAERDASAQQLAAAAAGQQKLNSTLDALGVTIRNANHVLASLDSAISSQDRSLASLESQATDAVAELRVSVAELGPAAKAATATLQNTAALTGDPAIADTLRQVDRTSQELALTSEHVEGSMKDIQAFVHRITTPARGTWNAIKAFLREFAGPAAQVATAAK